MGRLAGVVALLFALGTTPLWSDLALLARASGLSYAERRDRLALGFPAAEVEGLLERELGPDAAIALGPGLRDERMRQRLAELLYPRPIDAAAPAILERSRGAFSLRGAARLDPAAAPPGPRGSPTAFAAALAAVFTAALAAGAILGLGLLGVRAARALAPSAPLPARAAPLLGIALLGATASAATWLGAPLLTRSACAVALPAAALGLAASRRELAAALRAARERIDPATALLAALVAVICLRMLLLPVFGWDGRSIWLLHAKQLHAHGFVPRADLLREGLAFSHPEYPLALPAVLASFALPEAVYDERLAAQGLVFLLVAIAGVLFLCARDRLGGRAAALLTALYLLGTVHLSANAYADGFLAGLLAIQALCARAADPRVARLQWVAALCASLVKQEGLVFSLCIAVPSLVAGRAGIARSAARLAVYLPALGQQAFARALGLRSDFRGIAWEALVAAPLARAGEVAAVLARELASPGYDRCDTLVWLGLPAFLLASFEVWRRPALRREGALLLSPVVAIAAVIVAIFFLTPQDLAWHAGYAFDRLAISPALLSLLAAAQLLHGPGPKVGLPPDRPGHPTSLS